MNNSNNAFPPRGFNTAIENLPIFVENLVKCVKLTETWQQQKIIHII